MGKAYLMTNKKGSYETTTKKIYEVVSFQSYNVVLYGNLYKILVNIHPEFKTLCLKGPRNRAFFLRSI